MKKIKFFELSPSKKILKILEYIYVMVVIPILVLLSIDQFFNDRLLTEQIWSIPWFVKGYWVFVTITIPLSIYDFAKQIKSIKAKIICTAIFTCSVVITTASSVMLRYFPEKVPFDTLYFCIFALAMIFITLFEYKILLKKFGKNEQQDKKGEYDYQDGKLVFKEDDEDQKS